MMSLNIRLVLAVALLAGCGDGTGPAGPDTRFVSVAAGAEFTCGLVRDGRVFCWGFGEAGQLGNDTVLSSGVPVEVHGEARFTHLAVAGSTACAVTAAGATWCWGGNDAGQLVAPPTSCNGVFTAYACSDRPVTVAVGTTMQSLAGGAASFCGVTGNAALWCWGSESYLFERRSPDSLAAVPVADTARYASVSVGDWHACGLTVAGSVRCWGANWYGQLGDGSSVDHATPVTAPTGTAFLAVSAAFYHTCAIGADSLAYCWGWSSTGALGLGDSSQVLVPRAVSDTLRFTAISTGSSHTCAVRATGTVYCWGRNDYGQLGRGTTAIATVPGPVVAGPDEAVAISVGPSHSCAVSALGFAYCWGRGGAGQLGNGAYATSGFPVLVSIPEMTP